MENGQVEVKTEEKTEEKTEVKAEVKTENGNDVTTSEVKSEKPGIKVEEESPAKDAPAPVEPPSELLEKIKNQVEVLYFKLLRNDDGDKVDYACRD